MNWISVKDRLPEKKCSVLVATLNGIGIGVDTKQEGWIVGDEGFTCDNVTHWMPLPDPPKDVESYNRSKPTGDMINE